MLIYTNKITNRIRYSFDFIFRELLQTEFVLTSEAEEFLAYDGPKLNYSDKPFKDELYIYATGLLIDKGIKPQGFSVFPVDDTVGFFSTNNRSALPFDPFAATFYLISRYEEYLPAIRDKFGRFPAKESRAFKNNFLHQPVVDKWAFMLKAILSEQFPGMTFPDRKYQYFPSYDIDSAFAYLHKGLLRMIGGFMLDLKSLDFENMLSRTSTLLGQREDKHYTFDWLHHLQVTYNLEPYFFFLVGDYDEYDKNVSIKTVPFQNLMKSISDYSVVGLHPSYASNHQHEKLSKEVRGLSDVLKREIIHSRQHFLKLELPGTYQRLIENDITNDHTMGYASNVGFRAGTCTPFYFYNLDLEIKTPLKVHPFGVMDATLIHYLKLGHEEAIETAKKIITEVKKVNGTMVTVCHNNTFSEEKEYMGWRHTYEEIIKLAIP